MSALNDPQRQKAFIVDVATAFKKAWEGAPVQLMSASSTILPVVESTGPAHVEKILVLEVRLVLKEREARLLVAPSRG